MSTTSKIELKAVMTQDSKLLITDQDGREFDFIPEWESRLSSEKCVQIRIEIEYPHWPHDKPYVEVTFRVPLKVESDALKREFEEFFKEELGG